MKIHTIIGLISVTTDKRWKGLEEKLRDIAASFKVIIVYLCMYVSMSCMHVTCNNQIVAGNCR